MSFQAERRIPMSECEQLDCGLFASDLRQVPLEGVRIDARLEGLGTEVTVAQRYRNRESCAIEAVYVFPLEEGAAVCGFEAKVGERIIRGRVEEREEAFEIYDDAMEDGHGAFLLDQERPNVFTASVGNLRPGEAVEIRITYVALATHQGAGIRLMIPTTVSPRYVPRDMPPEVGQSDGERVNPERWREVPYGLELRVEVEAGGQIAGVESPSHPVRVRLRETGATVELARDQTALDRDFVLVVETAEPHRPSARAVRGDDGSGFCQVTFYPDLEARSEGASEVIFLLDCSGSMLGDSIDQARRALALSIRALEEGDSFQIVRFGNKSESLWSRPRPFDDDTLEEATRYIEDVRANLGGTEILKPLRKALQLRRDPDRRRQILLLTDGEVANESDIVALAEDSADAVRIFTFGIGAGSSEYLVRELARVTGGAAEFIFPGERIEPKVLRMFGRVRMPALDDVRLDWGGLKVEQAPSRIPAIFAGDSLTLLGRFDPEKSRLGNPAHQDSTLTLSAAGESWSLAVDFDGNEVGGPTPKLWARERIRELERRSAAGSAQRRPESERRRRRRLVELGRTYGLLSSATSYVAIEERSEAEKVKGAAHLRRIPIALTVGWGGRGRLTAAVPRGSASPKRRRSVVRAGASQAVTVDGELLSLDAMLLDPAAKLAELRAYSGEAMRARGTSMAKRASAAIGKFFGRDERSAAKRSVPRYSGKIVAERSATEDRLYELLMTQAADGSFPLGEVLRRWLDEDLAGVERAASEHGEAVVATAVAVALLERDAGDRIDEWRPAARKARQWLARQGVEFDACQLLKLPEGSDQEFAKISS